MGKNYKKKLEYRRRLSRKIKGVKTTYETSNQGSKINLPFCIGVLKKLAYDRGIRIGE